VKTWAVFLYGVAVGLLIALLLRATSESIDNGWLWVAGITALALGLFLHQRSVQLGKGRRWRRTW
jgi:hypothetical protein